MTGGLGALRASDERTVRQAIVSLMEELAANTDTANAPTVVPSTSARWVTAAMT